MPLSDSQLERYARQVVVPGIGEEGQQRLLGARVLVLGQARGVAQAALYLSAAGVGVETDPAAIVSFSTLTAAPARRPDAVVVAGVEALSDTTRRDLLAADLPLCWYLLEEDGFVSGLHPAAPLPLPAAGAAAAGNDQTLHDAAACDAAASACALVLGLEARPGPARW